MKVASYSIFSFLFFLLRSNGKKNTWMRTIFVTVRKLFQKCHSENYLISVVSTWFKFLNNYEARWQRHLKDTLQLQILWIWIKIRVNSLLGKHYETKMGDDTMEIISCIKICSSLFSEEHCTKIFHVLYCSFSPKRT